MNGVHSPYDQALALVVVTARPPEEGAAVVDTAQEEAPGRYVAAEFPFDTPGEWTLEGSARLADGRRAPPPASGVRSLAPVP